MVLKVFVKPPRKPPRQPDPAAMRVTPARTSLTLNVAATRLLADRALGKDEEIKVSEIPVLLLWDEEKSVAGFQVVAAADSRSMRVKLRKSGAVVVGAGYFIQAAKLPAGTVLLHEAKVQNPANAQLPPTLVIVGRYEPHEEPPVEEVTS